jgi:hypothetical protein
MPPAVTRYWIEVRPTRALVVGKTRGVGNITPTLDYIPGATFRGALAALNEAPDWDVFLKDISFPDLTPGGAVSIPLSARTCKYGKGFRSEMGLHGVYDLLLPGGTPKLTCDWQVPDPNGMRSCDGDLDRFYGWMIPGAERPRPKLEKLASGHTAIDICTRTAAPGLFFLEESISAPDGFAGELIAWGGDMAGLEALLGTAATKGVRIGHGVRKGMGWGSLESRADYRPGDPPVPLADRIRGLQDALNSRPGYEECAGLSVTLRSRAILMDNYLRFRSRVETGDLLEATQLHGGEAAGLQNLLSDFVPEEWFTATSWAHGWNAASGLPRSPDLAIEAGACFLFLRKGRPLDDAEIEAFAGALETLEIFGIGERGVEGFGRVVFCDPFHWRSDYERVIRAPDGGSEHYVLH